MPNKFLPFKKWDLEKIPIFQNDILSEWIKFELTDTLLVIKCSPKFYH